MAMFYDIIVEKEFTASSTDMLDSTDLENPPDAGLLKVWLGSTVNTATFEASTYAHQSGNTQLIRKRSDGIPNLSDDPPICILPVKPGIRPVLVLAGTTGTVHMTAVFTRKR